LDLASFIPGIGPTAAFTPGPDTPAPFNVSHTGLTDGTSPSTASLNQAEVYNRLLLQIASVIVTSGLTIDNNNWAQLPAAIQAMISSAGYVLSSTYATDFVNLLTANGYQEFKGGQISQRREVSASPSSIITITYPITFPNTSFTPRVSATNPSATSGGSNNFVGATLISYTNSSCQVAVGANSVGSTTTVLMDVDGK
jgi:hypothetical protein